MEELKRRFQDPPAAYRGKPFWSWNGELEEQELLRQIGILSRWVWVAIFAIPVRA